MKYLLNTILISVLINSFNCSFQSSIFNKMNKGRIGENLIISPLSIFQILSLTANGANGETKSEMLELLQVNTLDELNKINYEIIALFSDFSTVDIANAVMTRFTPLQDFINTADKYLAPIEPLVSVGQINDWVNNKTHGKIDKIIETLNPEVLMVLINAVYFKGEWSRKFMKDSTRKLPFYNFGKEEKNVDTMTQINYFLYYEDKSIQAIELKYKEDYMSALIILPAEGTDINKFINTLSISNEEYNNIIERLEYAKVHLQLPKFEVNFAKELNQILIDLGMFNAFSPKDADFTGLREEGELYISQVIHKTYLNVNEHGTEAAAATAVVTKYGSLPNKEKIYDMKINRPFLFLLRNSQLPFGYDMLFMSKIEKME